MCDAGVVTVPGPRGEPISFAVSYTVREYDPTSAEGCARLDRIHGLLHGMGPGELLMQVRRSSMVAPSLCSCRQLATAAVQKAGRS